MILTPRMRLISVLIVILVALPSGISIASVYSSQYMPVIVSYEEPAIRLSNYSTTLHNGQVVDISSYNVSATSSIEYGWTGTDSNGSFHEVNYSNSILLQSISQSPFVANLSLKSLNGQYKDLSNFSVYFQNNGTFYSEFSMSSINGSIINNSFSENAIFNRTLPIRLGIVFQPATNQETERINNVLKVGAVFSINISDITGNNVEIYTQYEIGVNLTLTTMAT